MADNNLHLFALKSSETFGKQVAEYLGTELTPHEERDFEDGEHKIRALESVRNGDVFVICSLYSDEQQSVNDKLVRLLFMLGSLRDAGARRLTAVVPYLCYARKDRKTKPRDPVSSRYLAQMFEAVGIDGLVTMDVHNLAAFQNGFRCRTDHLEAQSLFAAYFSDQLVHEEVVVASPDVGGIKRAESFRQVLEKRLAKPVTSAFMEKRRSGGAVSGSFLVGDVEGRTVVIVDDIIAGGTTVRRMTEACRARGARKVLAAASHGHFSQSAEAKLAGEGPDRIVITNSVHSWQRHSSLISDRLTVVNAAPLFAEAIGRMHRGGSIVELLAGKH